ncbi:MAG: homoserine kinase [Wenzhouxiangellaceae bacterium]|nr:homoserine kinase [Wenzhouxiangellaceae bacterium]
MSGSQPGAHCGSTAAGSIRAWAPASVGNVAVGFDLLGHALAGLGDTVTLCRSETPDIVISDIRGVVTELPRATADNTAARAVKALLDAHGIDQGCRIEIEKGIPLASGLGGSAASAVAAVVAANRLFGLGLSAEKLYPFALAGETVASGAAHGDNVGPQLLGGLVLATADRLVAIPVPAGLTAVAVHPEHRVNTRDARACLAQPFELATVVRQQAALALVLSGCYDNDLERIGAGLEDVMIEPRRAALVPGFAAVKAAALDAGALGASISGAGPTVFAWFAEAERAAVAATKMVDAFAAAGKSATAHVSPVAAPGARVIAVDDDNEPDH